MNNYIRFAYKLKLTGDKLYLSGESIYDESQNVKPITFYIIYKGQDSGIQVFITISST